MLASSGGHLNAFPRSPSGSIGDYPRELSAWSHRRDDIYRDLDRQSRLLSQQPVCADVTAEG